MSKDKGGKVKKDSSKCESTESLLKDKTVVFLSALTVALAFIFILLLPQFIQERVSEGGNTDKEKGIVQEGAPLYRHPLTGAPLFEPVELPRVFGVMIDNHEEAWPPSGIDQAVLVIEAPVEAGISRMLAFFTQEQDVEEIGPVRSARPYYLDWNNELDALYTHVGGSNAALDLIASGGTFDFNEYWNGDYFWRSTQREAPHNAYTSTDDMKAFVAARQEAGRAPNILYGVWQFKDAKECIGDPIEVRVDFWAPIYSAIWNYDVESRQYLREQAGAMHLTADGHQIKADNVGIVITDVKILDSVGRREIRTLGEGKGYVLQDGIVIEGIWKKNSSSERLRFYDEEGNEIKMNAGTTWIEVLPDEGSLEFMQ